MPNLSVDRKTLDPAGALHALGGEPLPHTDIAQQLFISEKTVKNHIHRIFTKLRANNRGHAVSLWLAGTTH